MKISSKKYHIKKFVLSFILAFKNHKNERYTVNHEGKVKDGEITENTDNHDMQRLIEEANLKIVSVS